MKYFDFVANRRACLWRDVKTILPKPIARACFIFLLCTLMTSANKSLEKKKISLTIGSYVSVRSSRYEARGKFGEHERCIRVAWGVTESNSSFLSALQTSRECFISRRTHSWRMNQLGFKSRTGLNFFQVLLPTTRFSSVLSCEDLLISEPIVL